MNSFTDWGRVLANAFTPFANRAGQYLPSLPGAFALLLVGWFVARCLEPLPDEPVSGLPRGMGPQPGVAVLDYLPDARRNSLLAQLPAGMGMAFRLLPGYPQDTVGAWMDPRVVVLAGDATAASALRRLREARREIDTVVFVVGAGQRLLVPITLRRLGQDPAQSSSIILTTVIDIVGFFSFLRMATLLSGMLAAS